MKARSSGLVFLILSGAMGDPIAYCQQEQALPIQASELDETLFEEDEGLQLPLLEEEPATTIRKVKEGKPKARKAKTTYPYDRLEIELDTRYGFNDNVFQSADYTNPYTGEEIRPQDDSFFRNEFDLEWDHYFSRDNKISIDYDYYNRDYRDLDVEDNERHLIELEWRRRLKLRTYLTLGIGESRKLRTVTNRFGEPLNSDLDYFRTDLYLNYETEPVKGHEIELEYRFVDWNYDELSDPNEISDDFREHRFIAEYEREFENGNEATAWVESRYRDYREEQARDSMGDYVNEGRTSWRNLAGVRIERAICTLADLALEIEYDRLEDPFQDYYSYNGFNYAVELDWRFLPRWELEAEWTLYDRDYDKRKFLASRLPDPARPTRFLDPDITLYEYYRLDLELTYQCSDNLEVYGGYRRRWKNLNDPTEEYVENQFHVGLLYEFRWRTPKPVTTPQ